ncbi:hypothetical protein BJ944DRAFT_207268 [Cunninghamella echinulata]|nr:hypothetical protein BJ944DRAFT_207268 [Cunninghamella echinulata]
MSFKDEYPDYIPLPQPDTFEIITHFVSIIGITLMSVFLGIKTYHIRYKTISYSKWLVILLCISSWAFIVGNNFVAITNNANRTSCIVGDYICVVLYGISKLIIYVWLVERVWLVKTEHTTRWKSKTYCFLIFIVIPYIIGYLFFIYYFQIYFTPDGKCYLVLDLITAIFTIAYDSAINLFLTIIFVHSLLKITKHRINIHRVSNLERLAYRSLIASVIALIASITNSLTLAILHSERGVICFFSCDLDIILNVIVIYWVTTPKSSSTSTTPLCTKDIRTIPITHTTLYNSESSNIVNVNILPFSSPSSSNSH